MATDASLGIVDYIVFTVLLFLCCGIGVFHALRGRKMTKVSTKQYLLAGGEMPIWPVTLSLMASFMSAITLLGTPTEIYIYGTMYLWIAVAYLCVMAISAHVYIPVFYRVEVTSAYEYLEMRFSRAVRASAAIILIFQMVLYLAMVLYAPCLALQAVTGLNLWGTVIVLGIVCTFYTTIGGLKAVIWTDALQIVMMFVAMIAIFVKGCVMHGGLGEVWAISERVGRIEFFNLDWTARHSIWSLIIGGTVMWSTVFGVNQAQVQRALSVSSLKQAQKAIWFNVPGLTALVIVCSLCGLVLTATYAHCDPIMTKQINAYDQFLPLFVMEYLSSIPGMAGLFVAGLFAGSLSTLSAGFNALAAVTLRDILQSQFKLKITDEQGAKISRGLACLFGLLCTALTYPISLLGGLLQAGLSLFGSLGGPLLGVFTLGMLVPYANSIGALISLWVSAALLLWISLGYHILGVSATIPKLPRCTDQCPVESAINATANSTSFGFGDSTNSSSLWLNLSAAASGPSISNLTTPIPTFDGIFAIHTISYLWYSCIALAIVLVLGTLISLCTRPNKLEDVDPKLLMDFWKKFYPKNHSKQTFKIMARNVSEFHVVSASKSFSTDPSTLDSEEKQRLNFYVTNGNEFKEDLRENSETDFTVAAGRGY